jgi:hypothetical protein
MPNSRDTDDAEELTPDATGVVFDSTEESPVESVEHLGDALKRLAQGAGKPSERDNAWDTCLIEEGRGLTFNGTVTTQIQYPFGFTCKLGASHVKVALQHMTVPTIEVEENRIRLCERGTRFDLMHLMRDCAVPDYPAEGTPMLVMGTWLSRLLPVLPSRSGHNVYAGALACEDGYVGTDGRIMVWTKATGPKVPGVVPREVIERLPMGEVHLHMSTNRCWFVDGGTTWSAPLLEGNFPSWRSVFDSLVLDRSVTVERAELLRAMRAAVAMNRHGFFRVQDGKLMVQSARTSDTRTAGAAGSGSRSVLGLTAQEGADFTLVLDLHRLLGAVDRTTGKTVKIQSEERQDRALVTPVEMQPETLIMQMCLVGTGAVPD